MELPKGRRVCFSYWLVPTGMVWLCLVISTAQWAGFPDKLDMSCRPQGHAGHRLSLLILFFTSCCGFIWLLHSIGHREKASP